MTTRNRRRDEGMTLIELIVALTIFGVVVTTALAFMANQNTAFQVATSRLVALRNLRYATATLSQDLETLGTNVPGAQPSLFYAASNVIAFAADYATNIENDPFAVFRDPDAPTGQVIAPAAGLAIPNSSVTYPDTVYETAPGVRSPAEVIVFFMAPDTSSARSDDYVLFRQVNQAEPEAVARNLLRNGTDPFFSYEMLGDDGTGALVLTLLPDTLLPIHHSVRVHSSPADTGRSALADSVRAVRVSFGATNGRTGEEELTVALSRLVPLPNAGFGMLSTCGAPPILGVGVGAASTTLTNGEPAVALSWNPAVDEAGGEADVVRYMVWRRSAGVGPWGDPYLAIPAGAVSYTYEDAAVTPGTAYQYALAAQDCTPSLSDLAVSNTVVVP